MFEYNFPWSPKNGMFEPTVQSNLNWWSNLQQNNMLNINFPIFENGGAMI